MALSDIYIKILQRIPGITEPLQRMTFKDKFKWKAEMDAEARRYGAEGLPERPPA